MDIGLANAATGPVLVGDLQASLDSIVAVAGTTKLVVVSDACVHGLHGQRVADIAEGEPILVPRGEEAKSWSVLARIIEKLADRGVSRSQPILALGGGSIGDVTGLAASLYMRGIPIIHVPTTLLAQVDSAVGGKTAIDCAGIKNLAGSFHQPALVVVDPALLETLDERQVVAGYAEIVKYGLIDDQPFFEWCERSSPALLAGDREARLHAIRHCLDAKARLAGNDPFDRGGSRTLLNLGHTFAHAIESESGLGNLLHGEAVSIGLVLAFRFSHYLGFCGEDDVERVAAHLAGAGLPVRLDHVGVRGSSLGRWMLHDKKKSGAELALVLVHGIGRAFIARPADRTALERFLAAL